MIEKNILISVIIPVFNAEKYIGRCLKSVCEQTYENIEIICIDDGSNDLSSNIIKKMQTEYRKINYYFKENGGPSSARNIGIDNAKGEFIVFLDADDYIEKNAIEKLLDINKGSLSVLHRKKMNEVFNDKLEIQKYLIEEYLNKIFIGEIGGYITGILFKKNKLLEIRFDENTKYMEDTIFLIQYIIQSNIKEVIINEKSYYYYSVGNENSLTNSKPRSEERVMQYCYSLDKINKLTDYKYNDAIQFKKIVFLEADMSIILLKNNFKEFYKKIKIENNKSIKSIRYKIFIFLYIKKKYVLLKFYYIVKKFVKKLRKV